MIVCNPLHSIPILSFECPHLFPFIRQEVDIIPDFRQLLAYTDALSSE